MIDSLLAQIESKYPFVKVFAFENQYKIELQQIEVPEEHRNSGIGSEIVRLIQDYAKTVNKPVVLRPEAGRGKKGALDRFYKRLGFVDNSGRNKDYSLSSTFGPTKYWRFKEWLEEL